jgi:FAD/FMN-containing dehydrogenase
MTSASSRADRQKTWTNWAGNESFDPAALGVPADEDELIELVRTAVAEGTPIRVAGSGHSFTPIVATDGLLLSLEEMTGVVAVDATARTAEIMAGTRVSDVGPPLWQKGLALKNQGDVDTQTIAGATATGTKGSGPRFGTMSSAIRSLRLINGLGEMVDIDASQPELLAAAQVSLGLLGVITRVTMDLAPAYDLAESNAVMTLTNVLDSWEELLTEYRHFSFWWAPCEASAAMYELPKIPPDHCYVKLLRELPASQTQADDNRDLTGPEGSRTGPAYVIYPDVSDEVATHVELEYMVDASMWQEAFMALRDLMRSSFPEAISPIQVRWQRRDDANLSAQYGRDSVSISVSGEQRLDYHTFLRAVHKTLLEFSARPHWGKMHYFSAVEVRQAFPGLESFLAVRRQMDPRGLFLNAHFRDLFAI